MPVTQVPTWLKDLIQSGCDIQRDGTGAIIRSELVEKLWTELELAICLSGTASSWQEIRDNVFDFARSNFHSDFSSSQKASFLNFIDKGGCAGVQYSLSVTVNDHTFQQEAKDRIDSDAIDDIVRIVCAFSQAHTLSLSDKNLREAVSRALQGMMQETFLETTSIMAGALLPIQQLMFNTIQSSLQMPSNGEGVEQPIKFIAHEVGGEYIRQRSLQMAEGYCEFLNVAKIWIATSVCIELVYATLDHTKSTERVDWKWVCGIIELVREVVMPVERVSGRTAEVARRRFMYWLQEASKSRDAWGARPNTPEDHAQFRDQEQWEEACALMGDAKCSWILS